MNPGGLPAVAGWLPVAIVVAAAVRCRCAGRRRHARRPRAGGPATAPGGRCSSSPGWSAARCCSASRRSRSRSTARSRRSRTGPAPASSVRSTRRPTGSVSRAASTTRSATPASSGTTTTSAAPARPCSTRPPPPTPGWATRRSTSRSSWSAGVNWSHYLIADGGELLAPLDKAHQRRHPRDVRRGVHHLDRHRAARAGGDPAGARHARGPRPADAARRRSPCSR